MTITPDDPRLLRRTSKAEIRAERERRELGIDRAEQADRLSRSFRAYCRAAWSEAIARRMVETFHIDSIADHVQAAYEREILRLLVTIPPGYLKSTLLTVLGPTWRWTHAPWERILSASHAQDLAERDTRTARLVMQKPWWQSMWGDTFSFARDENLKGRYSNDAGGRRTATHVGGGTGERGDVLILDDPHNAEEAAKEQTTVTDLMAARSWWGSTWVSRLNDSVDEPGVMIVIGQRISELDLIQHILDADAGEWTHLCLPAWYEPKHPYVTPATVVLPSGRELQGDVRTEKDQLLAPDYRSERSMRALERTMTSHVAAGQLQQRPTAREGDLIKRHWWRAYRPQQLTETDEDLAARLPGFQTILQSWDFPLKEAEQNDLSAGTCWGRVAADRYLLDERHGHMNSTAATRAVVEMAQWARTIWPNAQHYILIERGGYGQDVIRDVRRLLTGVVEIPEKGDKLPDKFSRAAAAVRSLEHGNVWVPAILAEDGTGPDEHRSPAKTVTVVSHCAQFPNGRYKDVVDSWSQAMNWFDKREGGEVVIGDPSDLMIGLPESLPR